MLPSNAFLLPLLSSSEASNTGTWMSFCVRQTLLCHYLVILLNLFCIIMNILHVLYLDLKRRELRKAQTSKKTTKRKPQQQQIRNPNQLNMLKLINFAFKAQQSSSMNQDLFAAKVVLAITETIFREIRMLRALRSFDTGCLLPISHRKRSAKPDALIESLLQWRL